MAITPGSDFMMKSLTDASKKAIVGVLAIQMSKLTSQTQTNTIKSIFIDGAINASTSVVTDNPVDGMRAFLGKDQFNNTSLIKDAFMKTLVETTKSAVSAGVANSGQLNTFFNNNFVSPESQLDLVKQTLFSPSLSSFTSSNPIVQQTVKATEDTQLRTISDKLSAVSSNLQLDTGFNTLSSNVASALPSNVTAVSKGLLPAVTTSTVRKALTTMGLAPQEQLAVNILKDSKVTLNNVIIDSLAKGVTPTSGNISTALAGSLPPGVTAAGLPGIASTLVKNIKAKKLAINNFTMIPEKDKLELVKVSTNDNIKDPKQILNSLPITGGVGLGSALAVKLTEATVSDEETQKQIDENVKKLKSQEKQTNAEMTVTTPEVEKLQWTDEDEIELNMLEAKLSQLEYENNKVNIYQSRDVYTLVNSMIDYHEGLISYDSLKKISSYCSTYVLVDEIAWLFYNDKLSFGYMDMLTDLGLLKWDDYQIMITMKNRIGKSVGYQPFKSKEEIGEYKKHRDMANGSIPTSVGDLNISGLTSKSRSDKDSLHEKIEIKKRILTLHTKKYLTR